MMKNPYLAIYIDAAKALGVEHEVRFEELVVRFKKGSVVKDIFSSILPLNDQTASTIASSKKVTNYLLAAAGLPVPEMRIFTDYNLAAKHFKENHQNSKFVVKPNRGFGGKGVTINPKNEEEFKQAFKLSKKSHRDVLVEEFIEGSNYRVLILDNKVLAVAQRISAFILGNGINTIAELIQKHNEKVAKDNKASQIPIDLEVSSTLKDKNLSFNSVPRKGEQIFVRRNSNLSTGGSTIDCTDLIHPDNIQLSITAAKLIGLRFAGVDLIISDISKSYKEIGGKINELNSNPGLRIHYYPSAGKPRPVAIEIIKTLMDK